MNDRRAEPFTAAEARLAARMHRWSDHGVVPIDAADIARRAATARPSATIRGPGTWSRVGSRRTALVLAALLLVGLVVALAAATLMRTPNPSDAYRAVVTRPVDRGVDVVLATADGTERVLRHVTPEVLGIDPRYTLGSANLGQAMNQQGWLELRADAGWIDQSGLAASNLTLLVDLADPARAPIVVLGNGFMSGRWGPDGSWAHYCAGVWPRSIAQRGEPVVERAGLPDCGMPKGALEQLSGGPVRVLDPDRGLSSEIIIPKVQTFGGGPDIFWTADGSGFLGREGSEWGVTPINGGPFLPGLPTILSREQYATVPDLDERYASVLGIHALADYLDGDWYATDFAWATSVDVQRSVDWVAVWQLLAATDRPSPQAVIARLTRPGTVDSVHTFDVPEGLRWAIWPVEGQEGTFTPPWFKLAPDDTFVALGIEDRFVLAPLTPGDQAAATGPVIHGDLAGLVPAAAADTWPGQ